MASQMKNNVWLRFAEYFSHLGKVRKIGLPPMEIADVGRLLRAVHGVNLCFFLAQAPAQVRADESAGPSYKNSLSFERARHRFAPSLEPVSGFSSTP
jgi:hypothetical protein